AYDELFLLQTSLLMQREAYRRSQKGSPMPLVAQTLDAFVNSLPFSLTNAQRRVTEEILGDMAGERPMARLLQGEVGSGKTVVAAIAALAAMASGYQVAVMAPTEILAEQHARTFTDLYAGVSTEGFPIESCRLDGRPSVVLITGSLGSREKEHRREQIVSGQAQVIIGTHALIEEGIAFQRLGLVVVDEQHRFGVLQRSILRQKGYNPHVLVMTATPIPRTLALTVYSDLDLSVIAEKPPGRPEVRTRLLDPQQRERAYQFVRQRVVAGEQGFIVCPLIEESEKLEAKAATAEYQRLSAEVFPDLHLGLLHGRMKAAEKDQAMLAFRERQFDLLVCTTVIEVGIDIPNATIMMVEGADRFGLAQLHQLRGRVGRGDRPGYCLLVAGSPSEEAQERLKMLERSDDGFQLAEWDLKLRGPGEFFGTRQSGLPELRIANIEDLALAEETRRAALQILDGDPSLERPEHLLLAREVRRLRARLEELS
ncbi:MAG: ATP-dependent DNA helicase RecG, partial [Chloroflexi bacterium]|nr:ATP-dependent DNA helicase RecG [Chloroflexota bacterium]